MKVAVLGAGRVGRAMALDIVDAGIAPGCSNLILGRMEEMMDETTRFECVVGGLPVVRHWPFQYKAPFSPWTSSRNTSGRLGSGGPERPSRFRRCPRWKPWISRRSAPWRL
ncbi:MAG: hypothetical protein ABIF09_10885 [Gemmatimonadota bacterium]